MEFEGMRLLQGTLDLLVLNALKGGVSHGYAVASWIRNVTDDRLRIEDGALYTALHRMEKRGWLDAEWGVTDSNRRARFYRLTAAGRKQLRHDARIWVAYAEAVFAALQATQVVPAA